MTDALMLTVGVAIVISVAGAVARRWLNAHARFTRSDDD